MRKVKVERIKVGSAGSPTGGKKIKEKK